MKAAGARGLPAAAALVPRAGDAVRGAVLSISPRNRRRLLAALIAVATLSAFYHLAIRDSPLVAVERTAISGLTTRDAPRIRAALRTAAEGMTTLHVRQAELEKAVAAYPVVRSVRAEAAFPHVLRIVVVEHRPVAVLNAPGQAGLALAADGTVLRGLRPEADIPRLRIERPVRGTRLTDPLGRAELAAVRAAPAPLQKRIQNVSQERRRGVVVRLRRGPLVIFGEPTALAQKWAAAARVLADPTAAGAAYVDVRLPERPAAGGLPASLAPKGAAPGQLRPEDPSASTTTPGAGEAPAGSPGAGPGGVTTAPDGSAPSDPAQAGSVPSEGEQGAPSTTLDP